MLVAVIGGYCIFMCSELREQGMARNEQEMCNYVAQP